MAQHHDPHIDYHGRHSHPLGETRTARMRAVSRIMIAAIGAAILAYAVIAAAGWLPHQPAADAKAGDAFAQASASSPPVIAVAPFVLLLLSIAILPLLPATEHWWNKNRNRFLLAAVLGIITLVYYGLWHPGGISNHFTGTRATKPGLETVFAAFSNAILADYLPFIILLFSLYVISGGISLRGDLPARPATNALFIGTGTVLASLIGTTGAAMVLIRPLLATNIERRYKTHTVIFFIFMVCNCGGLLLPTGDPPLFLGYLRGVPFTWTLRLWPYWLGVNGILLAVYYLWDCLCYKKESRRDIARDETEVRRMELHGKVNFLFLAGVVLCVAVVVPHKPLLGTSWEPPDLFRECAMLALVILSLGLTHPRTRVLNRFDYAAIIEVAALFCGIFICMQVPIEILRIKGPQLGVNTVPEFFWATGALSSFLDNAPTYAVFFQSAAALPAPPGAATIQLLDGAHFVERYLISISLAAVMMGANTYIGNGPNFMVKSIAEQAGVKMPSFFGYMFYSGGILIPIFIVLTWLV